MSDDLEQLRNIRRRVQEIANDLNLTVEQFNVIPGETKESSNLVHIAFVLSPEAVQSGEQIEQNRINREFELMLSGGFEDLEEELSDEDTQNQLLAEKAKIEQAKRAMQAMLDDEE